MRTLLQKYYRATVCGSVVIVGLLLYFHTIFFDYVYLDDTLLVEKSSEFLHDIRNVPNAFTQEVFTSAQQGDGIFYRPLLTLSFILDANIFGGSLVGYRLTNIALHVFSSVLVFILLRSLRYSNQTSFLLSLFFTVHPLFAQAVAWIPGRNDTLLTVFVFLSFLYFLHTLKGQTLKGSILHLFFFALAIFTKENAVVLPILCVIYFVLVHVNSKSEARNPKQIQNSKIENSKRFENWRLKYWDLFRHSNFDIRIYAIGISWFLLPILLFFLRSQFVGNAGSYSFLDSIQNILMQLPGILVYLGKIFFPLKLSVYPELSDSSLIPGIAAILLISIGLLVSKNKRWSIVAFGILWFLLFLLPTFGIREKYSSGILREHRVYIPMIGILFIFAEIVSNVILRRDDEGSRSLSKIRTGFFSASWRIRMTKFLIPLILISLFLRTYYHSYNFRNSLSFWTNATETSPSSSVAYINLGASYERIKDLDRAETSYKRALELAPDLIGGHNNLGVIYLRKNMLNDAKGEFEKELTLHPDFEMARRNLKLVEKVSKK